MELVQKQERGEKKKEEEKRKEGKEGRKKKEGANDEREIAPTGLKKKSCKAPDLNRGHGTSNGGTDDHLVQCY